ncbi:histidine kinase [Streptomyces sp. W007]|nr:histidine kinase [Streptomyces sp. W007]
MVAALEGGENGLPGRVRIDGHLSPERQSLLACVCDGLALGAVRPGHAHHVLAGREAQCLFDDEGVVGLDVRCFRSGGGRDWAGVALVRLTAALSFSAPVPALDSVPVLFMWHLPLSAWPRFGPSIVGRTTGPAQSPEVAIPGDERCRLSSYGGTTLGRCTRSSGGPTVSPVYADREVDVDVRAGTDVGDRRVRSAGLAVRGLRRRLSGGVLWSPARIVGEAVLAVTLAGLATGIGAWVDTLDARTVLLAGVMALLAPARHALPATVLILSAPLAGGWSVMASVLLVCAAWSAGRRITEPWRVAAAFGAACVLHTVPGLYHDIASGVAPVLPVTLGWNVVTFLTLAVVPALVGRYRDQRRRLLGALWQNNQQLRREQAMVAREARLLERNRIAHDMHDSLGHQLALISVHAGALQVDPELTGSQREAVRILRGASVTAMAELRAAVGVLHDEAEHRGQQNEQHYQRHESHQGNRGGDFLPGVRGAPAAAGGRRCLGAVRAPYRRRHRRPGRVVPGRGHGGVAGPERCPAAVAARRRPRGVPHRPGGADQRPQARAGRPDTPCPAVRTGQPGRGGHQRASAGWSAQGAAGDQRRPGVEGAARAGRPGRRPGAHRAHRGRRLPDRGDAAVRGGEQGGEQGGESRGARGGERCLGRGAVRRDLRRTGSRRSGAVASGGGG